jgi:hypothetical protein
MRRPEKRSFHDENRNPADFDPYVAVMVLHRLSDEARRQNPQLVRASDPLFKACADVLADAREWLDQFKTPFDDFAGDVVLAARRYGVPIPVESLASYLANAAFELSTMARLVELRDVRVTKSDAAPVDALQSESRLLRDPKK